MWFVPTLQIKLNVLYLCSSKANLNLTRSPGKNNCLLSFDMTRTTQKMVHPTILLSLRVYSLTQDSMHQAAAQQHIQTHRHSKNKLTTGELLEAVFSLRSNAKLHREDNSMLRTLVSSQSQRAETQELEDIITEPQPSNGCLHVASLIALFQLSGAMSHISLHGIVMAVSSGSTIPAFRNHFFKIRKIV
jgi:hypothetical protein